MNVAISLFIEVYFKRISCIIEKKKRKEKTIKNK